MTKLKRGALMVECEIAKVFSVHNNSAKLLTRIYFIFVENREILQ